MLPAVLREAPQYRLLFGSQVLSVIGDRVTGVALPFAVLAAGGGVTEVGLVAAAQFVPFLLFGLIAGVLADRYDRRLILILSDGVRMVSQAVAGVLLVTGNASPGILAVTAIVFGTADAFFAPAITGLIPQTLPRAELIQPANALRGLSYSAGSVGGPALAGILIAIDGPGLALLFDAATFAVSIALLLPLRTAARTTPVPRHAGVLDMEGTADPDPSLIEGLKGGWWEVRSRSWVWSFLIGMAVYHVVVLPAIFVLGPVLADDKYGGAESWAIVVVAFGVGALVGDFLMMRWRPRFALRVAALMLIGASMQAAIIGSGLPVAGIAAFEFLAGIAVQTFFTLWETSLQEHIPADALSRVSSYDYVASAGLMPLGFAVAAPVSAAVGVEPTLFAMSAIGALTAVGIFGIRSVRQLPRATAAAQA